MAKSDGRQLPLWDYSLRYVHIMRAMFDSGEASDMGGSCFLLWCCMRTYSDFNTGVAYPSVETLSKKLRQTPKSTHNQLKKLIEGGYVEKKQSGGKNFYRIIDKFKATEMITDDEDTELDSAYVPELFTKRMSALKKFRSSEITPDELRALGVNVSIPQTVVNNFFIKGNNNKITNNQVIIQKQETPEQDSEAVLRQLVHQRDNSTNALERQSAERWIEIVKGEMRDEGETVDAEVVNTESAQIKG